MADYGQEIRLGSFITPLNARPDEVVRLAVLAERSGLDLVTVQDHPYQPRFLDTWMLLSFVAARTGRVLLAPNVTCLPLRPPAVLARAAASLDALSGGRFELGLGAGAFWDAIEAMGGPRRTPGEAVQAFGEAVDVIRGIWRVDGVGPLVVDGEFYRLRGAKRGPRPPHDVEIWVGANGPRMLALIGAKGDGWLPSLARMDPGALGRGNAIIDDAAAAHGRDPARIRRLLNISGEFTAIPGGRLHGPVQKWVDDLAHLALDEGVSTFILASDEPAMIERFGQEVAPALRDVVARERGTALPG